MAGGQRVRGIAMGDETGDVYRVLAEALTWSISHVSMLNFILK